MRAEAGVPATQPSLRHAGRFTAFVRVAACGPALALIGLIVVVPVGWLFLLSFRDAHGFTLHNYARMLANPGYALSLETTLLVSVVVTAATAILAYPTAYFIASLDKRYARRLVVVVLLPLWTALLVRTFAWMVLLQRTGPINQALLSLHIVDTPLPLVNNFAGTVIAMTHVMVPFMVLTLLAAMRSIDGELIRAARSLGASRSRAFWTVFFPLSKTGLFAGAVLIFVMSLGYYVIPAFLGGGRILMWSMKIESNINVYPDWGAASALGVVLLAIAIVLLGLGRRLVKTALGSPA